MKFLPTVVAAALSLVSAVASVSAQSLGGAALNPVTTDGEASLIVAASSRTSSIGAEYRGKLLPVPVDFGIQGAILAIEGLKPTLLLGSSIRAEIVRAGTGGLPVDASLTLAGQFARPDWNRTLWVVPVGLSLGRTIRFETEFAKPAEMTIFLHPRLEYTLVRGVCTADQDATAGGCREKIYFRYDVGARGGLGKNSGWMLSIATGERAASGNLFTAGLYTRW